MEYFYRDMRRRHRVLLEGEEPVGGKWNFDAENRKPPAEGLKGPKRISHLQGRHHHTVLALVEERFADNMGSLDSFHYAVTAEQAQMELQQFIDEILPNFGDYQDAMVKGEPYLYHSLISSYVNAGLLLPIDVIRRAEAAWFEGLAPLNAVEGFIRQILGWREYVRGIYWTEMPDYAQRNHLSAARPLPQMYWTAKTDMVCMKGAIGDTIEHAYSHHIQRLMVTAISPCWPGSIRQRSASGISASIRMPMNGWNCRTRSAWLFMAMAGSWRASPMRRAASISTG